MQCRWWQVKEAQSYVIQVSTWEHLETITLDIDTDLLERNLLIVLCTPQTEKAVDKEVGCGGFALGWGPRNAVYQAKNNLFPSFSLQRLGCL